MANFKIIKKNNSDIWVHSYTNDPSQDLILSIGYFRIVDNLFELYSESGGQLRTSNISDVIVQDSSTGGGEETFLTGLELATRLKALSYPYFPSNITGAGGVDSVFGRSGVVTAQVGDYNASQINNDSSVFGTNLDDALEYLYSQTTTEWANYSGTRSANLVVTLGDYDGSNKGTKIVLNDEDETVKVIGNLSVVNKSNSSEVFFDTSLLTSNHNYILQDGSGTIAFLSDISGNANIYTIDGVLTDNRTLSLNGYSLDLVSTNVNENTGIHIENGFLSIEYKNSGNSRIQFSLGANFMLIKDQINSKGVEYAADYSANYTDRSLVDKAFVLAQSSSITLQGHVTGSGSGSIYTTIADGVITLEMLTAGGTPSLTTFLRGDNTWATVSGLDVSDWSKYTGDWATGDGNLLLGDVDGLGSGARIEIDGQNTAVYVTGIFRVSNNITLENNSTLSFKDGINNSVIKNGILSGDVSLTLPVQDGTFALISDIPVSSDELSEGTVNIYNKIPSGGTANQILSKVDSITILSKVDGNDYSLQWVDQSSGGGSPAGYFVDGTGSYNSETISIGDGAFAFTRAIVTIGSAIDLYAPNSYVSINTQPAGANVQLTANNLTQDRFQAFPDKDGTFAMLSDIVAGIGEAPNDGKQYARQSLGWTQIAGGSLNTYFETGTVGYDATVGIGNDILWGYDVSSGEYNWQGGNGIGFDQSGGVWGSEIALLAGIVTIGDQSVGGLQNGFNIKVNDSNRSFSVSDIDFDGSYLDFNGEDGIWYSEIPSFSWSQIGMKSKGLNIEAENDLTIFCGSGYGDGMQFNAQNGSDITFNFEMDGSSQFGDFRVKVQANPPASATDDALNTIGSLRFDSNYMYYNFAGTWLRFEKTAW